MMAGCLRWLYRSTDKEVSIVKMQVSLQLPKLARGLLGILYSVFTWRAGILRKGLVYFSHSSQI